MRTPATLILLTAIGCGGASESSRATTPPESAPVAAAPAAEPSPAAEPAAAPATPAETAAAPQEPAATPAATTPASAGVAKAELKMVSGDKALGTMTFEQTDKTININGQFTGLKKGQYALYIHSKGDCSDKGKKVGEHLNPTKVKHGPPASAQRHAGDFGNLTFDKDGNATFSMATDSVTLEPGRADSVLGRAVVIHARKDNAKGSAGSAVACGVVQVEGPADATRSSYTGATPSPASATTK
jgi:superoxide dismutase, Cu-Zn family